MKAHYDYPITVAYNMEDKKIGCVLLQTVLGATFPSGDVALHFEPDRWELSVSKCRLYTIKNEEEFFKMKELTNCKN